MKLISNGVLILVTFAFGSVTAHAKSNAIITHVHDIYPATAENPVAHVLIDYNGLVLQVQGVDSEVSKANLKALTDAFKNKSSVKIQLQKNDAGIISKVIPVEEPAPVKQYVVPEKQQEEDEKAEEWHLYKKSLLEEWRQGADLKETPDYQASVLEENDSTLAGLYSKHGLSNKFKMLSQCFRRAHTWAYEMFTEHQIYSMKAFLFFTKKYIREHNYRWWFHVAPFVYVKDAKSKKPKEMVIERTYHPEGPIEMSDWYSLFVEGGLRCPVVNRYQDYEIAQETQDCVIRKVPMYYYQPENVEALDKQGLPVTQFMRDELIDMGAQSKNPHYIE